MPGGISDSDVDRVVRRVTSQSEHAEVIRLSTGTWVKIFIALGIHAGALLVWGVKIETRMTAMETSQISMQDAQHRIVLVIDKLEDRLYEERRKP